MQCGCYSAIENHHSYPPRSELQRRPSSAAGNQAVKEAVTEVAIRLLFRQESTKIHTFSNSLNRLSRCLRISNDHIANIANEETNESNNKLTNQDQYKRQNIHMEK